MRLWLRLSLVRLLEWLVPHPKPSLLDESR